MKFRAVGFALFLGVSAFAFAGTIPLGDPDPTGFCPDPGSVATCTTATGLVQGGSKETIGIPGGVFDMEKNGSGTSDTTWYMLVSIPEVTAGSVSAPTITSASFTQVGTTKDEGTYSPSSTDLYDFVSPTLVGDNSMNATNMFGANEQSAYGGTPNFFEVFEYVFTGAFDSNVAYKFTVGGSGLPNGTFLAASGQQSNGGEKFSTPFTVTGLVNGPGCIGCTNGNPVPEPSGIGLSLLGFGLIGFTQWRKRRQQA